MTRRNELLQKTKDRGFSQVRRMKRRERPFVCLPLEFRQTDSAGFLSNLQFLRQRLNVDQELEKSGLLNAQQELDINRCAIGEWRSQRDCALRE